MYYQEWRPLMSVDVGTTLETRECLPRGWLPAECRLRSAIPAALDAASRLWSIWREEIGKSTHQNWREEIGNRQHKEHVEDELNSRERMNDDDNS